MSKIWMNKIIPKAMNKPTINLAIIAAAFLVLVNVIVLAGAAYNRSGDPIASLQLTERELSPPYYRSYNNKENSGLALRLNWNVNSANTYKNNYSSYSLKRYGVPDWLTEDKLKDLGIDVDNIKANRKNKYYGYKNSDTEEVIVVLEYDGSTYQTVLKGAENNVEKLRADLEKNTDDEDLQKRLKNYEESLEELKTSESRLIAIDAGLDLQTLKQKYNDSSKYLMLRGAIYPFWKNKKLVADIKQLFISSVHVPLPYSKEINEITNRETTSNRYNIRKEKPRYRVELSLGKRLEIWVGGVSEL